MVIIHVVLEGRSLHAGTTKFPSNWGLSKSKLAIPLAPSASQWPTYVLYLSCVIQCCPNRTRSLPPPLTYSYNLLFFPSRLELVFPSFPLQSWWCTWCWTSIDELDILHSPCGWSSQCTTWMYCNHLQMLL